MKTMEDVGDMMIHCDVSPWETQLASLTKSANDPLSLSTAMKTSHTRSLVLFLVSVFLVYAVNAAEDITSMTSHHQPPLTPQHRNVKTLDGAARNAPLLQASSDHVSSPTASVVNRGGAAVAQPSSSLLHTLKVTFYFALWYALNIVYNSK